MREQHAQEERISKTGIRVKDINHPKHLRRTQKAHLNLGKSDSTGDKSHNREKKEGTSGIPVTGHIIGDRPSVNWGIFPRHSSSERRAKKQTRLQDGHSVPSGNTNLTRLGKKKTSTEERMRYIIYYRENIDNILAWKIIHNRLLG